MARENTAMIGTSGWHYDHWTGPFYEPATPKAERLAYYAKRFRTVEINNSFYQLPEKKTLQAWRRTVPEDFVFSVKGSRYITHMKKLKDPKEGIRTFLERIDALEGQLGPVLFQLPGRWGFNGERLASFLDELPRGRRYAFEFRDPSWHNDDAYEILRSKKAAFCIYEFNGFLSPKVITADFAYIRLHGPGAAYEGSYDRQTLSGWAGAISAWNRQDVEVFCYFDNDENGYAPQNASSLKEMLET